MCTLAHLQASQSCRCMLCASSAPGVCAFHVCTHVGVCTSVCPRTAPPCIRPTVQWLLVPGAQPTQLCAAACVSPVHAAPVPLTLPCCRRWLHHARSGKLDLEHTGSTSDAHVFGNLDGVSGSPKSCACAQQRVHQGGTCCPHTFPQSYFFCLHTCVCGGGGGGSRQIGLDKATCEHPISNCPTHTTPQRSGLSQGPGHRECRVAAGCFLRPGAYHACGGHADSLW